MSLDEFKVMITTRHNVTTQSPTEEGLIEYLWGFTHNLYAGSNDGDETLSRLQSAINILESTKLL